MSAWHLITCEFPPLVGGVSDHSRVLALEARARGFDVHVWTASGAGPMDGVQVHTAFGSFTRRDLEATGVLLDRHPAPRRIVLQWVPHGYGRRAMNVAFSRWIARRAAGGDEIDVIVHEPFLEFPGRSWTQPARALVQRHMLRQVLRGARAVWLTIPGWRDRLRAHLRPWHGVPRILPVFGTVPVEHDAPAVAALRSSLLGSGARLVGHFGAGGGYAEDALARLLDSFEPREAPFVFVCLGRGSEALADRLARRVRRFRDGVRGTGLLPLAELSKYLQACDALVQPYVDGVSGRRTTAVSALEHGVPVATTVGALSEPFWRTSPAVETVAASDPAGLARAVVALLQPARNSQARESARRLYEARFDPRVVLAPLFGE